MIKVGVLELQGGFSLHHKILKKIEVESFSVKSSSDLSKIDGLIIPGGESTTISLLIDSFNLYKSLINFGLSHPVLGTCAGLILMAGKNNDDRINSLKMLDIFVERNAYGRQIASSEELVQFHLGINSKLDLLTTFIRAPRIKHISKKTIVLGKFKGDPIAVLEGNHLGLTFHPELNSIDIFHRILFDESSQFFHKNIIKSYAA